MSYIYVVQMDIPAAHEAEMNRVYDALHEFLDFENAKRLIVYGIILIAMMIVRPDGLLTRDSMPRRRALRRKLAHA